MCLYFQVGAPLLQVRRDWVEQLLPHSAFHHNYWLLAYLLAVSRVPPAKFDSTLPVSAAFGAATTDQGSWADLMTCRYGINYTHTNAPWAIRGSLSWPKPCQDADQTKNPTTSLPEIWTISFCLWNSGLIKTLILHTCLFQQTNYSWRWVFIC